MPNEINDWREIPLTGAKRNAMIADVFNAGVEPEDWQDVTPQEFAPKETGQEPWEQFAPKQKSAVEDVAKTVGSNLAEGALALPMAIPNLLNQVAAGPQLLGRGIAENIDKAIGIEPQPRGEIWQPFYSSSDVVRGAGLDYEPETTAGKVAVFPAQLAGSLAAAKGLQIAAPKASELINNQSSGAKRNTQITADDIKKLSQQKYAVAEQSGGILKPNVTNKFIDDIDSLAPQTAEGKLLAGDSEFTKTAQVLGQFRDRPLTLRAAQEIDEVLSDKIDDFVDRQTGMLTKQGKKLMDIQSKFRDTVDNATDMDVIGGKAGFNALNEGRKLWSASARLRDIERIITRAEMTDNPATAIKTGFRTLANSSRIRGFSEEERALIQNAAKSGFVSDGLRTLGSRLIPAITAATGGGFSGTAAAQAATMASRGAATKIQVGKAAKVANAVANRALNPPIQQPQIPTQQLLQGIGATAAIESPMLRLSAPERDELIRRAMQLPPAEARKLLQQK